MTITTIFLISNNKRCVVLFVFQYSHVGRETASINRKHVSIYLPSSLRKPMFDIMFQMPTMYQKKKSRHIGVTPDDGQGSRLVTLVGRACPVTFSTSWCIKCTDTFVCAIYCILYTRRPTYAYVCMYYMYTDIYETC